MSTQLFFSSFLAPSQYKKVFSENDKALIVRKYLYISSISRILSSLDKEEQKDFIIALQTNETEAEKWILKRYETKQLLKEQIERMMLLLE